MPTTRKPTTTRPPHDRASTTTSLLDKLVAQHRLSDPADLLLIERARAALKLAQEAEAVLGRLGLTYETRTGRTLPRPEAKIARDANAEFHRVLSKLDLTAPVPAPRVGRPVYEVRDPLRKIGSPL